MKKYIFPVLFGLVLSAPSVQASSFKVQAVASSVEQANLDGSTVKPPATKKPAKKTKKSTKKAIQKTPKTTKSAAKPAKTKTAKKPAKKKTLAKDSVSTNTSQVESANLQALDDGTVVDTNSSTVEQKDSDTSTKTDTTVQTDANLPQAESDQSGGHGKGLAIAGISGVSGLGLMLLLKRLFFH